MDGLAHGRALIYGSGAARVGRRRLADPERILAEIHRLEKRLAVERDIEKSAAKIAQIYKAENDKTHKRNASSTDGPRFPPLDQLKGQLYALCKDQHGCRYLQKRLEENNEANVQMIFDESFEHMTELMSGKRGGAEAGKGASGRCTLTYTA